MMRVWLMAVVLAGWTGTVAAQVTFTIASPAYGGKQEIGFDSGLVSAGRIDAAYLGTKSLPFSWSGLPAGTKAIALVFDDPDARLVMKAFGVAGEVWTHWVVADLDPGFGGLKADAAASGGLIQGKNTFGNLTYGGPAPPADVPSGVKRPIIHVYRLKLYALSTMLGLKAGFTIDELMQAMTGKVLGTAQLSLSYSNSTTDPGSSRAGLDRAPVRPGSDS